MRRSFLFLIGLATLMLMPFSAPAQTDGETAANVTFFRIATGETTATYYAIGSEIAAAISNPPGGTDCGDGGACGVPGLLAAALASEGSVQNIRALRDGRVESGLAQADIAHSAQTGGPGWHGDAQAGQLRAIAALYPEAIHLVARADSGITSIADLAGKRVSINQPGSGTRIDAQLVLQAAGLPDNRLILSELPVDQAARQLREGGLDALFMVGGWPVAGLTALAGQTDITLVPIEGPLADRLLTQHPFFRRETLPAGTYPGQHGDVQTLSVAALWLTTADQPDQLIHDITRVLWNDYTQQQLLESHPAAHAIARERALQGLSVPLHPGAAAYYRGAGLLKGATPP
ncbi:TAXI family TRAP transporter solute-binding subunit [Paracoccus sp. M683]|uniref:TAXI family TRAP transporter solute-binding subunit n=1 Tax=Paracoccus sp. M683 TaxID=2594268 RepID=UPI001180BDE2|nr:TAXI family TRAP transporter solute-binding subunit [Paracoccus sp. M683]TRW96172.1 TAXI family TRAP transporter solute-binding subunit [Paracoccus sp. M683]